VMVVPRHWREREHRYRLVATKCKICGRIYFPPRSVCPNCGRKSIGNMEKLQLSGNGTVYTYTIVHSGMNAFKLQKPYILAIIELEEGPRVTGQIVDAEPNEVYIGMPVRMVFRRIRQEGASGIIHYGYKFAPR